MASTGRAVKHGARRFAGAAALLRVCVFRTILLPLMLLAVLLQADAVVKSAVMNLIGMPAQAASVTLDMAMPMPMLMGAPAMGAAHVCHPGKPTGRPDAPHGKPANCGYCAAAAHAPLLAFAEPVRPSCAVAFTEFRDLGVHGPRGPPALQPRARGPPLSA